MTKLATPKLDTTVQWSERVEQLVSHLGIIINKLSDYQPEIRLKMISLIDHYKAVFTIDVLS